MDSPLWFDWMRWALNYLVVSLVVLFFVRYFFGKKEMANCVKVLCFPVIVVVWGIKVLIDVKNYFRDARYNTRFEEVFGFPDIGGGISTDEKMVIVRETFAKWQREFDKLFHDQVELRKKGGGWRLFLLDLRIWWLKRKWWEAVSLAKYFGYETPTSFLQK